MHNAYLIWRNYSNILWQLYYLYTPLKSPDQYFIIRPSEEEFFLAHFLVVVVWSCVVTALESGFYWGCIWGRMVWVCVSEAGPASERGLWRDVLYPHHHPTNTESEPSPGNSDFNLFCLSSLTSKAVWWPGECACLFLPIKLVAKETEFLGSIYLVMNSRMCVCVCVCDFAC